MEKTTQRRHPWKKIPFGGLTASALRLLAMTVMLLDHLWATVVPGNFWMTCLGRLAFPIYAFQLTEGFVRTHNRKGYVLRLLALALLAEIPFNLMVSGSWFYPFHQNTVFTLLLGFWAVSLLERLREKTISLPKGVFQLTVPALLSVFGFPDYGCPGVLTVMVFFVFRNFWPGQLAGMVLLHGLLPEGQTMPWLFDLPLQSLAVLALIPIWLYNGKKGRGGRGMQYGAYLFYPLHMILLAIAGRLL